MELSEAIDILKNVIADEVIGIYCLEIQKEVECSKNCENEDCFLQQAIDTVITELNRLQKSEEDLMMKAGKIACEMSLEIDRLKEELTTRYNKGYQDGFHSARYDKYMNEIHGEGESAVKYLAIQEEGYLRGYADGYERAKDVRR